MSQHMLALERAREQEDREAVARSGKTDDETDAEIQQTRTELEAALANVEAIKARLNLMVADQNRRKRLRGERTPEDDARLERLKDKLRRE
ncbi:hypothetical protein [Streptomyces sp. NPDC046985]|uniref:hypothetical protein n=1 Tax=Streptomyces sp. NPDC046985 TaxID=3155377 RepID=UPI0033FD7861